MIKKCHDIYREMRAAYAKSTNAVCSQLVNGADSAGGAFGSLVGCSFCRLVALVSRSVGWSVGLVVQLLVSPVVSRSNCPSVCRTVRLTDRSVRSVCCLQMALVYFGGMRHASFLLIGLTFLERNSHLDGLAFNGNSRETSHHLHTTLVLTFGSVHSIYRHAQMVSTTKQINF